MLGKSVFRNNRQIARREGATSMTSAALAGLLLRQPFQPFRFVLGDHIQIDVDRPEQVRHVTRDRVVMVAHKDGSESVIDLDRVALIEISAAKRGGGK
jgi:hypothetical protein